MAKKAQYGPGVASGLTMEDAGGIPVMAAAPTLSKAEKRAIETKKAETTARNERIRGADETAKSLADYQKAALEYQKTFDPMIAKVQAMQGQAGPEQAMLQQAQDRNAQQSMALAYARGYNPSATRAAIQAGSQGNVQAAQQAAIMQAQRNQGLQQQELALMGQRAQAGYTAPQALAATLGESQFGRGMQTQQVQFQQQQSMQQQQLAYQYAAMKAQQDAAAQAAQRQQSAALLGGLTTAGAGMMMVNPYAGGAMIGAGLLGYGTGAF